MIPKLSRLIVTAALVLWAAAAPAHEFWIEPDRFQVESGGQIVAQFKNGEGFEGINLGFFDRRSARFDYVQGDARAPLSPRMGNIPVLDMPAPGDGLLILAHETTPSTITYKEWDKFAAFAAHKDFPGIRARHLARGLPEDGFAERYTRHVKALVGVGDAEGSDRALGLETEFVALANPYTVDLSGGLPIRLLDRGAPRADAQVEIFERAPDGTVRVTLTRTDAAGEARIPVRTGHTYLLDAVVLRESPGDVAAVWDTAWAALTFAVP